MKANFHTHTFRCGHATGHEREYIEEAIKGGFEVLGISDHTPWPRINGVRFGVGMDLEQLDEYVSSIKQLCGEYAGKIEVKLGLECEYMPCHLNWLKDTMAEKQLDYVILGNHFDGSALDAPAYFGGIDNTKDAMQYLRMTIAGMETGIYAYLAHPELFLRAMPEWNQDMANISRELCRAAIALHVPVEYNMEGVRSFRLGRQGGVGYPNRRFWDIAAEEGCTSIIGMDAHFPSVLAESSDYLAAKRLLDEELGMKRIDSIFEV